MADKMGDNDANEMLTKWLTEKGYSDAEIRIINDKLAQHDHETLSDAIFDSIGGNGGSLEDMISSLLKE
jgi:hypothetical protein